MIHFNPESQTFNLNTRHSFYAFQVDEAQRLIHLGWGVRPSGAQGLISGTAPNLYFEPPLSFITQFRPDELLAFGNLVAFHATLKASFPGTAQAPAAGESLNLPIRDLRLLYHSHTIVTDAQPGYAPQHGLPTRNTSPRETLKVRLLDARQLFAVSLCYRVTPEHDIIERWLELENLGQDTVSIEVCSSASLHLPNGTTELTSVSGNWAREFTASRERLPIGTRLLESRTLQTSHFANPFFLLNRPGQAWEESGTVYFGQLAYSGSWQIAFEQLPTFDVRVHAGYNPFDDQLTLRPHETHHTPALLSGVCPDGWGGASRRMHAFARERVLPNPSETPRPVLYNGWEASYFNLSYAGQAQLAQKAASIGVELFCVDDGWFGTRDSDSAGLGDWFVRESAFPQGMEQLVQEVHRLGMQFGLWVEPEMVNPNSDLYRAHPEWVLHFPGSPRTESRNQLVLDFGRPEVVEYIFNVLSELVTRYSVAFFKWDMNRMATEPGSVVGKQIWRKHVLGVYSIMDRLRAKHPTLDIQSCSGGGGRIDLGILGRTDQVWVSDNTDAFDRIAIQEGFSLAYPARTMEAWVTHRHNHQTQRVTDLALRFHVAMRGALGIGASLDELSAGELEDYQRYIAFYKRIRPVVQNGELYRLERLEEFGASCIEYVLPDGSEAVFSIAVRQFQIGSYRPAPLLKGLRPDATYAIYELGGLESARLSGYELMTLGLPLETSGPVGYCQTFHLKIVEK